MESQKKRRAGDRRGAKKRGRPRKSEPTPEISVIQEEAAAPQEAPAAVVVSEPTEIIPDQTLGSLSLLPAVESEPASVVAAPLPVFGSVQSPVFAPAVAPPASANLTQTPFSPSVPAPAPTKDLDTAPVLVQDLALAPAPSPAPDAPVPTLTQAPVPATPSAAAPAPPTAPSQVGVLYIESEDREDRNQVTIEDLGPDEEEDISLSQDKRADEGNKEEI